MKIVVIGGTGLVGKKLIPLLTAAGHDAVAASPSTGVNAVTGEGLAAALTGADVVVDVTNAPSWGDDEVLHFFTTSAANLGAAEREAGVQHHIAVSIVNCDQIPGSGYMRAKVAQEQQIRTAGVPFTILRATQFFEFLAGIADFSTADGVARLSTARFQPVAAEDVAATLADLVERPAVNGVVDLAGPEAGTLSSFVSRYLAAKGDTRTVVEDPEAGYFGAAVESLAPAPDSGARLGAISFEKWLG
ncbi:LysR family transcriptional regulator [Paractinoplanes deccanensis]|uniref:LysR family transcriptional regulator n=1 Tax=Paractinoplanes deccanensis TaxID=113561 RepID=A0ABQ3YGW8_9ACTN|nr:SDR family oxidoreductase [Actinoplanes deccanensis]GID79227.1 LysR family transcriptional regulator [Actinoplanes deccanensis]